MKQITDEQAAIFEALLIQNRDTAKLQKITGCSYLESMNHLNYLRKPAATPSPLPENCKTVKVKDGGTFPINDEETHVLYNGEWREIQEDQDEEFYFLLNGKAVYIEYPNQIPETGVTKSVEWFMAFPVSKRIELANKYFPEYKHDGTDLEDSEIHQVYLKETGTPLTPGNEMDEEKWEIIKSGFGNTCIHSNGRNICKTFSESDEFAPLIASAPAMYRALKRLLPIIEAERTQTGVSLSIRYLTEYEEAKAILNSITGGK